MLLALVKMSRSVNIVIAMVTLVIGYYLLSALPTTAGGILAGRKEGKRYSPLVKLPIPKTRLARPC